MLLGLVAILPLSLFSAIAFTLVLFQQKGEVEQATLSMTRALAAAIDARMQNTISALDAFSIAQNLATTEDMASVYAAARQIRTSRPDWRGVVLARRDGTVVFGSESPFGSGMRQVMEPASVAEVAKSRAPVIGPMTSGPRGNIGYTIRVPVMHLGELKYVLTAILSTESILDVVKRQQIPESWVASVFDSNQKRVARTKDNEKYFRTEPRPSLQDLLARFGDHRETVGITSTMEGEEAYTSVARIADSGWTIAMGAPTRIVQAPLWTTAWLYAAGLLLSLSLGGSAFWLVSRTITTRAKALRDSAVALGRGVAVPAPSKGFPDFDEVSTALWDAGELHARAEVERAQLLRSEVAARSAAEHARSRTQMLLSATAELSQSLDEGGALDAISSMLVPGIADIIRVDLLDSNGALQRKITFQQNGSEVEECDKVLDEAFVELAPLGVLSRVIGTGKEYVHHFDSDHASEGDASARKIATEAGIRAVCVVPLVAREHVIGVMSVVQCRSKRRFEADDVSLICDAARRAALALDNVKLYTDCTDALKEAKAANKVKDQFLAMLGHELRNPLAPILNAVEIMQRRDPVAFAQERQIIARQAKHLAYMVDDLLDISRILSGKMQLRLESVDLGSVINRAVELNQPLFESRSAPAVQKDAKSTLVRGDFLRLSQVVSNLLSNAVKFSAAHEPVRIELRQWLGQAMLVVEDNGSGIPDELLPHVFDLFVQSAQSIQREKSGLGLGLTIARSIVESHGGTIRAEQGPGGRGARFTVSLPLADVPDFSDRKPIAESSKGPIRSLRVMVIDDNSDAAATLVDLFDLLGHQAGMALSAEECLEKISEFEPEVCFVDIGLPGMDGFELARNLRANVRTRGCYLVALTGYGQKADRAKALASGFDDHMTKPADIELLELVLEKVSSST